MSSYRFVKKTCQSGLKRPRIRPRGRRASCGSPSPRGRRRGARAARETRQVQARVDATAPSSHLSATPVPSGPAAHRRPSAPPFANQPGAARMRWRSAPSGPPTSSGCARIAVAMRLPSGSDSTRAYACAMRWSGSAKVTTPHPSVPVGSPAGSRLGRLAVRVRARALHGVVGQAVALDRPALRPAEGEHAGVLARAVVEDLLRRAALLEAELEVVLVGGRGGEERPHGRDLVLGRAVRGAGDREQAVVQVGAGARDGKRLDRLRRGAHEAREARVAGLGHDVAAADGDRVHPVARLDGPVPAHLDDDGIHGGRA